MNRKQKRTNVSLKAACYLAFAALAAWLIVSVFQTMEDPYRTVPVTSCSERVTVPMTGIVAREETVLLSGYQAVHIDVEEGQRVGARGTVARVFDSPQALTRAIRLEGLEREAAELAELIRAAENTQQTDAEIQLGVRALRRSVRDQDYDRVSEQLQELHTRAFAAFSPVSRIEERLTECRSEMDKLRKQGAESTSLIPATVSGLFSSTVDGWETLTFEQLRQIEPDALREMLSEERSEPAGALGKLVGGIRWYYAALMDAEEADRLRSQSSVQVLFGRYYGEKLSMQVEWISTASDGVRTVVLSCDEALGEMLTARKQEAELLLREISGLRIPRRALHVDGNGEPCVYVRTGLQAERKQVRVLQDYGDYYMVESDMLRLGDEVIVGGKGLRDGKVVS